MNILVTGGAGFIGSHVCQRLLEQRHHVICVDNFFTGQRANVADLQNDKLFTLIEHDITQPLYIDQPLHQIYNLACPASPIHYQQNPIKTVKTSTIGMINMLGLAKKKGARILQASTSEVYGDPDVHPQTEEYTGNVSTLSPRACYDEGKRVAETLCMNYHREHGVEVRLPRIFNVYGPHMHPQDGRVVSNFIMQALSGKPITIYGDGSHTRSFCYVSDMVEGLTKLMNHEQESRPVNIGNPHEISILDLAKNIISLAKSDSRIVFKLLPEGDPKKRQPDISRARSILKWNPTVDLEEGLMRTISYFETRVAS